MLLSVFGIIALLGGTFALTISNITVNGQPIPVDLGYVNSNFNIIINATADVEANWTIVIWNETYYIKEILTGYNKTNNLTDKVVTVDITGLTDGLYYINLTAYNATNATYRNTTLLGNFTLDKTPPVIEVLCNNKTLSNNTWYNETLTCTINVTDNLSGVNATEIYLDGQPKTTETFNITAEGRHNLTIRAVDNAGNPNEIYYEFGIDLTEPLINSVNYIAPRNYTDNLNRTWVAGIINVTYNVSDNLNGSGIKIVRVLIDGGEYINSTNTTGVFTIDTTKLSSNTNHTFELEVCDFANHCNKTAIAELWIDNEAPYFEIVYPITYGQTYYTNGTWTNLPTNITVMVFDNGAGINWTAIYPVLDIRLINGTLIWMQKANYTIDNRTDYNGTIIVDVIKTLEYYTEIYGEGEYYFKEIKAYDLLGNCNYTYKVTSNPFYIVIYDITPPNVTLVNVTKADGLEANYINGKYYVNTINVTIYINATDNLAGVDKVVAYVNGVEINGANLGNGIYAIELTNLTDGEYNITVKAVDLAGNRNMYTLTIVVDTVAPEVVYAKVISPRKVEVFVNETNGIEVLYKAIISNRHSVNITNVSIDSNKVILTVNVTPLVGDNLTIELKDLAGNAGQVTVKIENAADAVYILYNTSDWHYIAFEKPIDASYDIFQKALTEELGLVGESKATVLMYKGDIGKTNPWITVAPANLGKEYGYGYAVKPDYQGREYVLLPVKFRQTADRTYITLEPGWNLVGIILLNETARNETAGYIVLDWTNFRHLKDVYYADPYERIIRVPIKITVPIEAYILPISNKTFELGFAVWVWTETRRYVPLELPNTP